MARALAVIGLAIAASMVHSVLIAVLIGWSPQDSVLQRLLANYSYAGWPVGPIIGGIIGYQITHEEQALTLPEPGKAVDDQSGYDRG